MKREGIIRNLREIATTNSASSPNRTVCALAADLIENQAREIEALTRANAAKTERFGMFRWIPVEEALPQPFISVLGYMPGEAPLPTVHECYYEDRSRAWYSMWCYGTKKVTHWMPMPEKETVEDG